jgi:hypothetical protein
MLLKVLHGSGVLLRLLQLLGLLLLRLLELSDLSLVLLKLVRTLVVAVVVYLLLRETGLLNLLSGLRGLSLHSSVLLVVGLIGVTLIWKEVKVFGLYLGGLVLARRNVVLHAHRVLGWGFLLVHGV